MNLTDEWEDIKKGLRKQYSHLSEYHQRVVISHEHYHWALANQDKFNLAADYAVNGDISKQKVDEPILTGIIKP